ncbi:MAG: aspartate aminotransferase family protein [Deltaproteobacteria bacterium HGW-Deltaproteobacteria-14]|nr:MAG: aspartate aminotransferase family protein [Deltaproteobacteria bacterium HGW-Deltaproteobacteria-14]
MERLTIPGEGREHEGLLAEMAGFAGEDADFRGGRTWSMVYWAGDEHHAVCERAHNLYMAKNALNPIAFKSLKRMEHEVVQMTAGMLHGPDSAVGTMTSGGTESLLLAVKTYRDRARRKRPWVLRPNMVVPETIHVAFDKAAHYFGVKKKVAPVDADGRVDVKAMRRLVDRNTVMLAASAPQYPHGTVDPIPEIGALAAELKLPFHVDACFGGFMLPWLERLGIPMPVWDFRVPGVTSISADLHKYGYAPKGASVIVYRDMSYLRHQFFVETAWSGGIYVSPSLPGTRPGGSIAAAWASVNAMGEDGYLRLARAAWDAAEALRAGIAGIDGLRVLGRPESTIVAWASDDPAVDLYAVADQLAARGWAMDRQQKPPSVHCSVNANNAPVVATYLEDMRAAVAHVRAHPELAGEGEAAVYGLMAKVPVKGLVAHEVLKVMEGMYGPDGGDVDLTSTQGDGLVQKLVDRYGDQVFGALERLGRARDRVRRALPF